MNDTSKTLIIAVILSGIFFVLYLISPHFNSFLTTSESYNGFSEHQTNETLIISSCTGDMKGLEVGVAAYAGNKGIPLILASKTIPYPLNHWLPSFIQDAHISKVIWVGPISMREIFYLKMLNLSVEIVDGTSKAQILTEMAEKNYKSVETVIITSADPSASLYGALIDSPVFVVSEPGRYTSLNKLPSEYDDFISKFNVKKVIVIGNVSNVIIDDLKSKNLTIDEIRGNDSYQTSIETADRIIDIQEARGIKVTSAYCGFYGELPSIIPLAVRHHSIIIQDPTIHMDEAVSYLNEKDIKQAIITRNHPADYLQMEESDFISNKFDSKLISNGINTTSLTNFRTINEATGLYEVKMVAAGQMFNTSHNPKIYSLKELAEGNVLLHTSIDPPPLDMIMKGGNWASSTGSQLTIKKIGLNQWYYQWKGIHPYIWNKNGDNWYCTSNNQYSWNWTYSNGNWTVEYLSHGISYYKVYWVKKGDLWMEIHPEATFKWKSVGSCWICTENNSNQSFTFYPEPFRVSL